MSDRQFYIDDETGRGHYASEPDDVSASFSDELLCCAPFTVEDFHSTAGTLYQYTLRHRESGEVIAPLTSQQGMDMKLLLQCWDIAQAT